MLFIFKFKDDSQASKITLFQKIAGIISGTEDVKKRNIRKRSSITPKRRQNDARRRKSRPVMIEMVRSICFWIIITL